MSDLTLSIDTAMGGCGVGLWLPVSAFSRRREITHGHAEILMPMVADVMAEAGVQYQSIKKIIVTTGPGSFTGLRVGLSAARALGLALSVPVMGISTLQAMAAQYAQTHNPDRDIAVLIDTRRDDVFMQIFSAKGDPASEPVCAPVSQVVETLAEKKCAVIGDAAARIDPSLAGHGAIDPVFLARYAAHDGGYLTAPDPVYLRGADVSVSKQVQRPLIST